MPKFKVKSVVYFYSADGLNRIVAGRIEKAYIDDKKKWCYEVRRDGYTCDVDVFTEKLLFKTYKKANKKFAKVIKKEDLRREKEKEERLKNEVSEILNIVRNNSVKMRWLDMTLNSYNTFDNDLCIRIKDETISVSGLVEKINELEKKVKKLEKGLKKNEKK